MEQQQFIMLCVYVLAGLLGVCVGSFLNVVIYRLPLGMSLASPGSHCPGCGYSLKWYDNVPVLSFVFLGGKCRKCKAPISPRYMLVELCNMGLWLLAAALFWEKNPVYACMTMVVSSALICIFYIDLEHMLIFNRFTLLVALGGVVAMVTAPVTRWYDHVIGGVVAGGVFLLLYYGCMALLQQEGLGFGDVKYAAAAGLLLGWQKFLLAILVASITGAVVMTAINRLTHADKRTEHPFGPYLVTGTLLALFFGDGIIAWYLNLLLF